MWVLASKDFSRSTQVKDNGFLRWRPCDRCLLLLSGCNFFGILGRSKQSLEYDRDDCDTTVFLIGFFIGLLIYLVRFSGPQGFDR